jgi:methylmalonyl-CoA/ethylmalonyl-CoA epimerase
MKIQLDHIGIATSDPTRLRQLFDVLGLSIDHTEMVPTEKVQTTFIPVHSDFATLELLEPLGPDSVIARFIEKRGPGIHHLSFKLEKGALDEVSNRLRSSGFRLTYDQARPGAHQMRVNFIHPADAGGVLIEIMEPM